jgi:hypothetical protein
MMSSPRPAMAQPAQALAPATVELPNLAFQPTPAIERNYDKYFYFHRDDTSFAAAYEDIRECDALARGITLRLDGGPVTGGVTGVIADAILGSAERRRIRRVNMRMCMGFKDYRIYGLPEALWEQFNFEEGLRQVEEARREQLLQVQARVASGPRPQVGAIAP